MLTPLLEQLVLSNQATIKTHNHGVGGVGSIQVPPGKQIVIVQIIWNPFVDVRNMVNEGAKITDSSGSFFHTLKLRNKANKYAFTFRDQILPTVWPGELGLEGGYVPGAPHTVNTFLPFTEGSVDIDIMKFNDFSNWGVYSWYLPTSTVEPDPSEGYGNDNSTNKFKTVINASYYGTTPPPFKPHGYVPPTTVRAYTNPNAGGYVSNEFEGTLPLTVPPNKYLFPTPEPAPNNSDLNMFPVVNFTYVEINARYIPGNPLATVNSNKK